MTEDRAPGVDMAKLAAILQEEYRAADSYRDILARLEEQAFAYYEAQPFGNEVDGRSQIVLPDVQETVDYMTQSVLRTFVSGDRTVEFEAVDEADKQAAEEATAAINWLFMRRQDGYRILHDGCNDGLLRKIGIFKTVVETQERVSRERVTIDPLMLGELPDAVQLESEPVQNEDGTITVDLKFQKVEKRFVDYAIAPGNFRFSPRARHEDEADYLCHVDDEKTRSDLVDMGFDPDQVYRLPGYHSTKAHEVESSELDQTLDVESSRALERVELCEEYARIDIDGDGIAERVKVFRVGNEILIDAETGEPAIETVDDQPFSVFCPFPRPHRLVGYSLADKVMDIQLARSFMARQLFDGMAFANMPRPVVDTNFADADTYNDILSPIPGAPIRVKGGVGAVQPFQTGFDIGKSLQAMEWLTGERESRTGITRMNQGLDADTLNKTATGTALMQAQGQQQEEYIARNLAETMARLFVKKYRLMRAEGEPFKVKVDGEYRMVDPSQWPEDININVRVGLGSGSKDKRIQARMAMANLLAQGTQLGEVSHENRFKLIDGLARDMGIGQGDDYWIDPANSEPKPEQPDPAVLEQQAKAEEAMARIELDRAKAEATVETERMKAQAQIDAMREKHALEMEQRREQAALEAELARERMAMEAQLAQEEMLLKASADVTLGGYRPGGDLNA
ncbi:MAG: hypothetical protein KG075_17280 [Alphaproteobacteria bacterium]|nr:hypothetical protein [Alphaproteobacteria bacterium]